MGSFRRLAPHSHNLLRWIQKPLETPETPVVDLSEGKLSDSEQEGPDSETPELDQLMLTTEEQMDYDSFALASPVQQGLLYGSLLRRLHPALSKYSGKAFR